MKYIILGFYRKDESRLLMEQPITFPDFFPHSFIGEAFNNHEFSGKIETKVLSAGFFAIEIKGVRCYGVSESLKISSRPERDTNLLTAFFTGSEALMNLAAFKVEK